MPHRIYTLQEVATHLHLSKADVERLARRNEIPFERKGEKLIFRRSEIDAWASQRLLTSGGAHVKEFHKKSSVKAHDLSKKHAIMPDFLKKEFIDAAVK